MIHQTSSSHRRAGGRLCGALLALLACGQPVQAGLSAYPPVLLENATNSFPAWAGLCPVGESNILAAWSIDQVASTDLADGDALSHKRRPALARSGGSLSRIQMQTLTCTGQPTGTRHSLTTTNFVDFVRPVAGALLVAESIDIRTVLTVRDSSGQRLAGPFDPDPASTNLQTYALDALPLGDDTFLLTWLRFPLPVTPEPDQGKSQDADVTGAALMIQAFRRDGTPLGQALALSQESLVRPVSPTSYATANLVWGDTGADRLDVVIRSLDGGPIRTATIAIPDAMIWVERFAVLPNGHIAVVGTRAPGLIPATLRAGEAAEHKPDDSSEPNPDLESDVFQLVTAQLFDSAGQPLPGQPARYIHPMVDADCTRCNVEKLARGYGIETQLAPELVVLGSNIWGVVWAQSSLPAGERDRKGSQSMELRVSPFIKIFNLSGQALSPAFELAEAESVSARGSVDVSVSIANALSVLGPDRIGTMVGRFTTQRGATHLHLEAHVLEASDSLSDLDGKLVGIQSKVRNGKLSVRGYVATGQPRSRVSADAVALQARVPASDWSDSGVRIQKRTSRNGRLRFRLSRELHSTTSGRAEGSNAAELRVTDSSRLRILLP